MIPKISLLVIPLEHINIWSQYGTGMNWVIDLLIKSSITMATENGFQIE